MRMVVTDKNVYRFGICGLEKGFQPRKCERRNPAMPSFRYVLTMECAAIKYNYTIESLFDYIIVASPKLIRNHDVLRRKQWIERLQKSLCVKFVMFVTRIHVVISNRDREMA